jgi:DNA-binding NtrC family response regulator
MPYKQAKAAALANFERVYFATLLAHSGNNVSAAAKKAGLDRSNFRRSAKRAGVMP